MPFCAKITLKNKQENAGEKNLVRVKVDITVELNILDIKNAHVAT